MPNQQSASALLDLQQERLKQLYELLLQEKAILAERRLGDLAEIPPLKAKLLIQLQQADQNLVQQDLREETLQQKLISAKAKLKLCKRLNEENGKMIALAMASIGKIQMMMAKSGHQLAASTTYTALGGTSRLSSTGSHIAV